MEFTFSKLFDILLESVFGTSFIGGIILTGL